MQEPESTMKTIIPFLVIMWWLGLFVFLHQFYTRLGPYGLKNQVVFSNDCTLGNAASAYNDPFTATFSVWQDTNYLGMKNPSFQPFGAGMMASLKLIGMILFYSPVAFCICGVSILFALYVFTMRIILMALCIGLSISCIGLLIGLISGKIDPSSSAWMAIYPIGLSILPWLMLGAFIRRDLYENTSI